MTMPIIDNVVWHTLAGLHRQYSVGSHTVRRYVHGFPPIAAFRNTKCPDWHGLAQFMEFGEHVHCDGLTGTIPDGWRIESESVLVKMVWSGTLDRQNPAPEGVLLDSSNAALAAELATLTMPGPFTGRTIELGEYYGIFDGALLVAMAGSRRCAGGFSEISGVCTHPDFTGRGLARRLVTKVLQRQLQRNERPFLRVLNSSTAARRLYLRIGFRKYKQSIARTIVHY